MWGCGCEPSGAADLSRFEHMDQIDLTVGDQVFRTWLARNDADRERGFMYVTEEQLRTLPDGAEPAMLFVFTTDRPTYYGFWMKNVPVPLDIVFIDAAGTIVSRKTMAAYDHRSTYSDGPYLYALEMRAGLGKTLGITAGQHIDIPQSVLNNAE